MRVQRTNVRTKLRQSTRGFSLVTVLLIGMCAILWLTAMTTGLLPLYQHAASEKTLSQLRAADESAIDYTIDQISNGLAYSNPSPLDDPTSGPPYTTFIAPSSLSNAPNVTVNVTVKNTQPPSSSALYNNLIANGPLLNYYRVIEATASNGIFSRSIRVVLQPQGWNQLKIASQNWAGVGSGPGTSFNPMGQYAVFAGNNLTLGNNTQTDGYTQGNPSSYAPMTGSNGSQTGSLGGDVAAYNSVTLAPTSSVPGSVTVGGSIDVPESNGSGIISAQGAGNSSTVVNRFVTDNGAVTGLNDSAGTGAGSVNVNGMNSSQFPADPSRTPLEIGQNETQTTIASAPSATPYFSDSSAAYAVQDLGDLNLNGVNITITNSAAPPPAGGYVIPSSGSFQMQPGNYSMSSVSMSGTSSITVAPDVISSQPVRFFINDAGVDAAAPSPAVNITSANGITNNSASPSNFQIYYGGDRSINLAQQSTFSGTVYAPNSSMTIGATANPGQTNYFGSFVGNNVSVQNAFLHYDQTMNVSQGGGSGYLVQLQNAYNKLNPTAPTNPQGFWYFQIVSWQEWPPGVPLPTN